MQNETAENNAQAASAINDTITKLDQERVTQLNNLQQIQKNKQDILQQERDRLSKINQNDPRVQRIDNRLAYNTKMFSGLDIVTQRANTQTTPLPADSWRIQGNVYSPDNSPAANVTVFFADLSKQWVEALGSACTDANGFYALTNDVSLFDHLKDPVYLSATDKKQQLSYKDSNPATPAKATISNQNIYFTKTGCEPPSAGNTMGNTAGKKG